MPRPPPGRRAALGARPLHACPRRRGAARCPPRALRRVPRALLNPPPAGLHAAAANSNAGQSVRVLRWVLGVVGRESPSSLCSAAGSSPCLCGLLLCLIINIAAPAPAGQLEGSWATRWRGSCARRHPSHDEGGCTSPGHGRAARRRHGHVTPPSHVNRGFETGGYARRR